VKLYVAIVTFPLSEFTSTSFGGNGVEAGNLMQNLRPVEENARVDVLRLYSFKEMSSPTITPVKG
jgi:hypothetical protein